MTVASTPPDHTAAGAPPEPLGKSLRELFTLAAPTVAQMASYTVMQFVDAAVLSRLGTEPPTAVGNAGGIAYALVSFGIGVMLVVNAMASEEYGRKQYDRCGRWMWQGTYFSVAFSMLLLPLIPFGRAMFHAFGHGDSLVTQEAAYFRITMFATVFKLVGVAMGQYLLATLRPRALLISSGIGVAVNAAIVAPLSLGWWGLPKGGVVGAAWAQNVGVVLETAVLVLFAFNRTSREKYGAADWRPRAGTFWKLLRIGVGSGVQVAAEIAAWSLFAAYVMGRLGENAMAASQFMTRYMSTAFMPALGIGQAVTALVGRSVGEKRPDLAVRRARIGYVVATAYMLLCGAAFTLFRYQLIGFFTGDEAVKHIGALLLIFAGIYQLFDAMNVIYTGALRGVSDTLVPALVGGGLCWGINVLGGALVTAYRPQWGVAGPWTLCTIYGIVLAAFAVVRFHFGPWRRASAEATDEADDNPKSPLSPDDGEAGPAPAST